MEINFFSSKLLYPVIIIHNYLIGCLILFPVLVHIIFVFYAWKKDCFDSEREKRFTWILLILDLWPQVQVFKMTRDFFVNKDHNDLENRKKKLEKNVLCAEAWIEAIPQYIFQVGIFVHLLTKGIANKNRQAYYRIFEVFGKTTLGLPTMIMFPINASFSFISGVRAIILYLNNGPLKCN